MNMNNEKSTPLVEARGLIKEYKGRRVVKGVSLTVNAGEVVGLLGPNGAGKTTSFYMVAGLVEPNGGQVFFNGEDITTMPTYQRARVGVGYLPQETSIFRQLTVEDNIMAILETLNLNSKKRQERLKDLLNELQLSHLAKQKAMTLSGGERRRLEITRALATNPSFIMLDEPFAGVDPINIFEVQKIVAHLRDRGLGVLITDHNVRDTLAVVNRAYLIASGEILCTGDSEFLMNNEEARKVYLGPRFTI